MKNILLYSPDLHDGVSFMRQLGPLSFLEQQEKIRTRIFSATAHEYVYWSWYTRDNICLMTRAYRYNDFFFAEQCKKHGLKIWLDLDDTLHHITQDNPVYELFEGEQTKQYINAVIEMADVVTVSSKLYGDYLKEKLKIDYIHIPNALDDRLLKYEMPYKEGERRSVSYRGSKSHMNDLQNYSKEILEVMDSHKETEFFYFGMNPYFITSKTRNERWAYSKTQNIFDFYSALTKVNANVHFTPLIDNFFNRVKSNLSWLDGTLAGSACLVPEMPEWEVPGVEKYNPKELRSFLFHFNKIIEYSDNKLQNMVKESKEYIKDNLLLSKINNQRMEIINNL